MATKAELEAKLAEATAAIETLAASAAADNGTKSSSTAKKLVAAKLVGKFDQRQLRDGNGNVRFLLDAEPAGTPMASGTQTAQHHGIMLRTNSDGAMKMNKQGGPAKPIRIPFVDLAQSGDDFRALIEYAEAQVS